MSAEIPVAFPEYNSETLDALLIDPAIRHLLDEIHEMNRTEGGMNLNEAHSRLNDLDRRWKNDYDLMGETATVTGYAEYYFAETDDEPGELIRRRVEDARVRSGGFTVISSTTNSSGEILEDPKARIALLFQELLVDSEGNVEGELPIAVHLDNLESIRFDIHMSLDQAEAILDYYMPHIRKEIDDALLKSDSEIEVLMALRDSAWDVASVGDDGAIIRKAITTYLEELLKFDELPYVVPPIDAIIYAIDDTGAAFTPTELELTTPTMLSVNRLTFLSPVRRDRKPDTDYLTAHLDCWLHMDHQTQSSARVLIPLDELNSIYSLRESFYGRSPA